jgi:hypothetical protein
MQYLKATWYICVQQISNHLFLQLAWPRNLRLIHLVFITLWVTIDSNWSSTNHNLRRNFKISPPLENWNLNTLQCLLYTPQCQTRSLHCVTAHGLYLFRLRINSKQPIIMYLRGFLARYIHTCIPVLPLSTPTREIPSSDHNTAGHWKCVLLIYTPLTELWTVRTSYPAPIYPSNHPPYQPIIKQCNQSTNPSINQSNYPSISQSIHPSVYLSIYLSNPSIYPPISPSIQTSSHKIP